MVDDELRHRKRRLPPIYIKIMGANEQVEQIAI